MLDGGGVLGVRFVSIIWDLRGDWALATSEEGDFVAGFYQETGEVDANETGATEHEDLFGCHTIGRHDGEGASRGGAAGDACCCSWSEL